MIVRCYGAANGWKITLTRKKGDRWEAAIPSDEDGEYIVELYAEDEAGNVGYMCTVLFAVSRHEMRAYVVPRGYGAEAGAEEHEASPMLRDMIANLSERKFMSRTQKRGYASETGKGGCKVEHILCEHTKF